MYVLCVYKHYKHVCLKTDIQFPRKTILQMMAICTGRAIKVSIYVWWRHLGYIGEYLYS